MNGEVKSYRLNEPMSWKEFKEMPDDIKVNYVKLLRQKYNVPGKNIAEMMGCSTATFYNEINRLGISEGKNCRGRCTPWDREGFFAWCNGVTVAPKEVAEEAVETVEESVEAVEHEKTESSDCICEKKKAIPSVGNMVFEGKVEEILTTVGLLLGGANVHINITWDVLDE